MPAGPLVPRVHAPVRARKPVPAVACAPDPVGGRPAPPRWLVDGLVASGVLVATLERTDTAATPTTAGPLTLWDLVGGIEDALEAAASAPGVDTARVGVLGMEGGAALALVGGSRQTATRVALLMPILPEIAVRRLERTTAGSPRDALLRTLAELQPLRTLAEAPARPTLILHAAADANGGPEHALAIAMGLHLDGRPIERLALACAAPEGLEQDAAVDEPACDSVVAALARFLRGGAA